MSYTVLARRYRSQNFDEVVGQEAIAKTLRNAIASERVAHAYLFTGTRGVGKTSMARILARALNAPETIVACPKPKDLSFPPKDVQERMGEAIMRGDDLNVIEIDGASNNSVEQARQLIANAGLSPTANARFKIYIIDEVHMLSQNAFNALLKTMEEPPSHVKFILCTTEPHKVPATIQSRCQRFDFQNIRTVRIAEHLKGVLDREKIEADEQLIWQLARLGNGSMRDALSLLDRLIATGEQPLALDTLEPMLGLPPRELVIGLVDALAAGDVASSLLQTAELLDSGIAQDQLIEVFIERLRQLMLISACGPDSELVELSDDAAAAAAEQANKFDTAGLVHMIVLCENMLRFSKGSSNPRALLDATIVRLALAEKMADVTALLANAGRTVPVATSHGSHRTTAARETAAKASGRKKKEEVAEPSATVASPAEEEEDPQIIWSKLLANTQHKASLSWIDSLRPLRFAGDVLQVGIEPGRHDLVKFVGARQKQQLAEMLGPIVGRPIRIELELPQAELQAAVPIPDQSRRVVSQEDCAKAMALPLVKKVMHEFDVSLVEIRPDDATDVKDRRSDEDSGHEVPKRNCSSETPVE